MAQITVLFGGQQVGTHKMVSSPFVVGRDLTCDLPIDNVGISREHSRFIYDGKHYFIEDMGSANGTYHHEHKIRKASLADGDQVQIGKYTLQFEIVPSDAPPIIKADSAEALDPTGANRRGEKSASSDNMLTFKMDAKQLQARMAAASSEGGAPKRAGDLAVGFAEGGAPAKSGGGDTLSAIIKVLIIIVLLVGIAAVIKITVLDAPATGANSTENTPAATSDTPDTTDAD